MAYPGGSATAPSSSTADEEKIGISAKQQAVKYVVDESSDAKSICQSIDESLSNSGASSSSSKMDLPLLAERQGDVISSHKALLTLAKGFVGTGCLSLPFAWKQGGLWVSFVLQVVISALNWYSNHILAKSAQYLAAKSARPSLDYGHFAKKVFDFSGSEFLKRHSRKSMYVVNVTVLLYQLGCSSVPIVFVATNLNKLFSHYLNVQLSNALYATAILLPLILVNMVATMKALSYLAMTATFLWLFGALTMLQQCFRMPSQWSTLPAYTDFWSTIMFFGTAMYSYEGQTMILPIENKMRYPEDFTENCGVLPTLMVLITVFYTSLGFYGYTAFGDETKGTLPLNMPDNTLFSSVSVMLALMAFFGAPRQLVRRFRYVLARIQEEISCTIRFLAGQNSNFGYSFSTILGSFDVFYCCFRAED